MCKKNNLNNILKVFLILFIFVVFSGFCKVQKLKPVSLRGYGTVSGIFHFFDNGKSCLEIKCESVEKAKILYSKFFSDFTLLGNVREKTINIKGFQVPLLEVEEQGFLLSVRKGKTVYIIAGKNKTDVENLFTEIFKSYRDISTERVSIPMYLDRWDKYGFSFYYRPWELPKGESYKNYNFIKEFDFAKKYKDSGLVFWDHLFRIDNSEGIMNNTWWEWAGFEAKKRNLPIQVNTPVSVPTYLMNRYIEEMVQGMPDYTGGIYGPGQLSFPPVRWLSWNSEKAQDEILSTIQKDIKKYSKFTNLVSFLEPHGELNHGKQSIFFEYGKVCDKSFRKFLKEKYGSLRKLSERWTGDRRKIKSWDEVKVPEIAEFCGWGKEAKDLKGKWNIRFFNKKEEIVDDYFKPGFNDKNWNEITAPGDDKILFLPRKKAIFRRYFSIDENYLKKHKNLYLYIWDLNRTYREKIVAYLNGEKVGESIIPFNTPHWCVFDVSGKLKKGKNLLAIYLPEGFIGYRIYLSPEKPAKYPNFGKYKNAKWVDFIDWSIWTIKNSVIKGTEMIRSVDKNRQIKYMAPDIIFAEIKEICEKYGGQFHNTGYMASFWANLFPMLMNGSNLPCSVEPGGPAQNLSQFKKMLGLWSTEGIQGIDYFIHIGNVMWNDEIRKFFIDNINLFTLFGKYHLPEAKVALLLSSRVNNLIEYPWGGNSPDLGNENLNLFTGYWTWNVSRYINKDFEVAAITDKDLMKERFNFPVIIDTNTSIMDEELIEKIKKYVENGGVFITFVHTGRHTSTEKDKWPISELTGYKVLSVEKYKENGEVIDWKNIKLAPDQKIFTPSLWKDVKGNGLSLKKISPDCQDLMYWEDGTVAAGVRKLGKGYIFHIGVKFSNDRIWWGDVERTALLFTQILDWLNVERIPAYVTDSEEKPFSGPGIPPTDAHSIGVEFRHYISNNGLYDIWVLWNSTEKTKKVNLVFRNKLNSDFYIDVKTGKKIKLTSEKSIEDIELSPLETKAVLIPSNKICYAPYEWFKLQRNWWRGTKKVSRKLKDFNGKFIVDLTDGWKFKILKDEDIKKFFSSDYDFSKWETKRLGVWNINDYDGVDHGIFIKKFKVPSEWKNGEVRLWINSWWNTTFINTGRIFLDGKLLKDFSPDGLKGVSLDALKPGTSHTLAIEIKGDGVLAGCRGVAYIYFVPAAEKEISLGGEWVVSDDFLNYSKKILLPGKWNGRSAKKKVRIEKEKNQNILLHIETDGPIWGAIVNGKWICRFHHCFGNSFDLNITPWINEGENEIEIVSSNKVECKIFKVSLRYYRKNFYP